MAIPQQTVQTEQNPMSNWLSIMQLARNYPEMFNQNPFQGFVNFILSMAQYGQYAHQNNLPQNPYAQQVVPYAQATANARKAMRGVVGDNNMDEVDRLMEHYSHVPGGQQYFMMHGIPEIIQKEEQNERWSNQLSATPIDQRSGYQSRLIGADGKLHPAIAALPYYQQASLLAPRGRNEAQVPTGGKLTNM